MVKVPVSATVVVPATVSLTIVLRRLEILVGPFDGRSRHVFLLRREKSLCLVNLVEFYSRTPAFRPQALVSATSFSHRDRERRAKLIRQTAVIGAN